MLLKTKTVPITNGGIHDDKNMTENVKKRDSSVRVIGDGISYFFFFKA